MALATEIGSMEPAEIKGVGAVVTHLRSESPSVSQKTTGLYSGFQDPFTSSTKGH